MVLSGYLIAVVRRLRAALRRSALVLNQGPRVIRGRVTDVGGCARMVRRGSFMVNGKRLSRRMTGGQQAGPVIRRRESRKVGHWPVLAGNRWVPGQLAGHGRRLVAGQCGVGRQGGGAAERRVSRMVPRHLGRVPGRWGTGARRGFARQVVFFLVVVLFAGLVVVVILVTLGVVVGALLVPVQKEFVRVVLHLHSDGFADTVKNLESNKNIDREPMLKQLKKCFFLQFVGKEFV